MIFSFLDWSRRTHKIEEQPEAPTIKFTHNEVLVHLLHVIDRGVSKSNKANLLLYGESYKEHQLIAGVSHEDEIKTLIVIGAPNLGEKVLTYDDDGQITNGTVIFIAYIARETDTRDGYVNLCKCHPDITPEFRDYEFRDLASMRNFVYESIERYRPCH